MTPERKQFIHESWHKVASVGDAAAAAFYDRLFEIDPSTRPLFGTADMKAQRAKLLQALGMVVAGLDRLEDMVSALEELGRRHVAYGVRRQHYRSVGAALLWTLEHALADAWTTEVEDAWAQAYAMVSGIMAAAGDVEVVRNRAG